MKLLLEEILGCTNGRLKNSDDNQLHFVNVSTDSRSIKHGDIFVPLTGERFDGHSFIFVAQENGAAAAFWQESVPIPDNLQLPLIIVDDTLLALQSLAKYYRNKINPKVIGVTGSNGKTTTKDLISSILTTSYKVHKTKGNLNNHIGVPLTILSMPDDTETLIVEMGMSNTGEIELLSEIAQPDIAVITNIGESHLEYLGTREKIAEAKLEILKGLKQDGTIILNGDEPLLRNHLFNQTKNYNVIWAGRNHENDVYPISLNMNIDSTTFIDNKQNEYIIPIIGAHNVINSMMAIEVGKMLNIPTKQIQAGLKTVELTGMRLEKIIDKNKGTIINDAYNASPTSMKASLDLISKLNFEKKIAVLGDMLELGNQEVLFHKEIGVLCSKLNIDVLYTTGKLGRLIYEGAKETGIKEAYYSEDLDDIAKKILAKSDENSIILIKASRGVHLEKLIEKLI